MNTEQTQKARITPKDFFLWAGAMVAFYTSVVALINLIFNYINYLYPDPLAPYSVDPYQSGISSFMAMIIVAFPIFLILMRIIRRTIAVDPTREEVWVRRWALMLTLFVAGGTIAGTLIVLLTTFLSGEELTTRFLLKIVTVLLVAVFGFTHFFADLRGYWKTFPLRARNMGIAGAVLITVSVIAGFFIAGTPQEARRARYDAQRVNELQNIQWQIVNYWQQKNVLPKTLDDLSDPLSGYAIPHDPENKSVYEYESMHNLSFRLCAVFNKESRTMMDAQSPRSYPIASAPMKGESVDNWHHAAGRVCFDRTIDPERYPPVKKEPKI